MYEEDETWDPLQRKGYTDPKEVMEQIHRTALLQKIHALRHVIIELPLSLQGPKGLSPDMCLQSLAGLREQLEEGAQPRKRTLLILNRWWRYFKNVA